MGYTTGYTTNKTYAKQYRTGEPILGLWKDGTYTCLEVQRESESYEYASLDSPIVITSKQITIPRLTDYEKDPETGEAKKMQMEII